ncbi:hypothetical protein [Pseudalkalibacillus hwajinpoensis]|uniref:Uncharacterized protein n=1 Tax=Guptibacillus hwajinpoensis TaxID=208199 RepID=A0A4U1MNP0_9BACL|nr:hypothetical protein [Pseudalkalibacillus hwajinpoensis]TKD72100.1 hypothetical protein FBF83_04685 [Pseudalkalibacillus hwajinpoensis]
MIIKRKRDAEELLSNFDHVADYDKAGNKHYIVFEDFVRNGHCTIMKYDDTSFSIHGKGDSYCDENEQFISKDELASFLWKHRKAVNHLLKSVQKESVS